MRNKIQCNHSKENITTFLVSPLETGIRDFLRLVTFFMYKAPMIDCIHSKGSDYTESSQQEALKQMLTSSKMDSKSKFIERIQKNSLELMNLDGNDICLKCPRLLCSKKKNETELCSLLRHLRNGFAHGRLYIKRTHNQTYVVIDDFENEKKQSARIVITKTILIKWYKILVNDDYLKHI